MVMCGVWLFQELYATWGASGQPRLGLRWRCSIYPERKSRTNVQARQDQRAGKDGDPAELLFT